MVREIYVRQYIYFKNNINISRFSAISNFEGYAPRGLAVRSQYYRS